MNPLHAVYDSMCVMAPDAMPPSVDDLDFLTELGFQPEGTVAPTRRRRSLRRPPLIPVVVAIFVLEGLGALGAVLFFHQRAAASLLQRTATSAAPASADGARDRSPAAGRDRRGPDPADAPAQTPDESATTPH